MVVPTRVRRIVGALFAALIVLLVAMSPASADNVQNDVVAGGNDTIPSGGTTIVSYRITSNNGDGQTGCNAADATPATVDIVVPPGVTANPDSLVFSACAVYQQVEFTSTMVGSHDITVSVDDNGVGSYNINPGSFTLKVNAGAPSDTTAPVVTTSGDVTVEATSSSGATATFTASATDNVDGAIPATCAPPSGSVFALGTTAVICSATDAAGNSGTAGLAVTVEDTTAPVVTVPADMTIEATGPSGAEATFSASASDLVDGAVATTCDPASGSTFPLGDTTVTCSATDAAANTGDESFVVTVEDTTAPTINVPANITVDPTGVSGAVVVYGVVTATDLVDGELVATCTPPSGSTFTFGTTTVTCSATDAANNTAYADFDVTVNPLTLSGFYQPVDMGALNTVKGGSTVPLKFEVFAGATELTTTDAVKSFSAKAIGCPGSMSMDDIEVTSTGGTSLRYDATGGQFIQNWQTPKKPGNCYEITMTTVDGAMLTAQFKLK